MTTVVVREYARLTTDQITNTLDQATISPSAFDHLCQLSASFKSSGAALLIIENRQWLRLDNYVGVLETPCGTTIEILPKHIDSSDEDVRQSSRDLLVKMLTVALGLPIRTTDTANIQKFRHSLVEWVMSQFVLALDHTVKRGLRFDYHRVEETQKYLRGQLDINKQLRSFPGQQHIFNIRHDLFLVDRSENRLLKTALMRVCSKTKHPDTWQLSHKLAGLMHEVPDSRDIKYDFNQWKNDRLMAHYQTVKPLCELVLGEYMPIALQGLTRGISLLFPMEKLFERYVEVCLRKQLVAPFNLKSQSSSYSLCSHEGRGMFQLKPDLLVQKNKETVFILDTKWKRISADNVGNKYDLKETDFYQMFAYGHNYLKGSGHILLIYPMTSQFTNILNEFKYNNSLLRLWVTPFDLNNDRMHWPEDLDNIMFR